MSGDPDIAGSDGADATAARRRMNSAASNAILLHLAAVHRTNPQAETSGLELQRMFGLDAAAVRLVATQLAAAGFVEWDPLLTNVWLRITDAGLAVAERQAGDGHIL